MNDDEFWEMNQIENEIEDGDRSCLEDDIRRDINRGLTRQQIENKYKDNIWFDSTTIDSADYNHTLRNRECPPTISPKAQEPQSKTAKVITWIAIVVIIIIFILLMIKF